MNIKLINKGEFFILQNGGEVIKCCGCCGKQLNAKAAAILLAKLQAGEFDWKTIYEAGIAAEFSKK